MVKGKVKRSGFSFHYKIIMDGVSESLLYLRTRALNKTSFDSKRPHQDAEVDFTTFPCFKVGPDPGKKSIVTLVDERGVSTEF